MKIYTRTGDAGETSLYRGGRIAKDAARLDAYGTLDELNSTLGLVLALLPPGRSELQPGITDLTEVQRDLFRAGAQLATIGGEAPAWHLVEERVILLEKAIDRMESDLPVLESFLLPGGHPAGAALHLARTVCRRAEREVVRVHHDAPLDPLILRYLNRLSDFLFVAGRWFNRHLDCPEPALDL